VIAEKSRFFVLTGGPDREEPSSSGHLVRVFVAPPWAEIFAQDAERKHDFVEAVRTHSTVTDFARLRG
jgi:predicted ATPase